MMYFRTPVTVAVVLVIPDATEACGTFNLDTSANSYTGVLLETSGGSACTSADLVTTGESCIFKCQDGYDMAIDNKVLKGTSEITAECDENSNSLTAIYMGPKGNSYTDTITSASILKCTERPAKVKCMLPDLKEAIKFIIQKGTNDETGSSYTSDGKSLGKCENIEEDECCDLTCSGDSSMIDNLKDSKVDKKMKGIKIKCINVDGEGKWIIVKSQKGGKGEKPTKETSDKMRALESFRQLMEDGSSELPADSLMNMTCTDAMSASSSVAVDAKIPVTLTIAALFYQFQ
jgi:hypothetical protein